MQSAKHSPAFVPRHETSETEIAVWAMILILVGVTAFAVCSLFVRIAG
jgi:hypothetical protein